jgi:choline dehydrogenase-like flavoprotein
VSGTDVDVVIIGGGAAGIGAARRLAEYNVSILLLEAGARLGGRAWTHEVAGLGLDLGCGWLAAEGVPTGVVIAARHRDSTIVAMRSILAEAAKWTIEESDRGGLRKRLWRPFGMAGSSRDGVPENARGHVDVEDRQAAAAALVDGHMARSGEPLVSLQVSRMVRA